MKKLLPLFILMLALVSLLPSACAESYTPKQVTNCTEFVSMRTLPDTGAFRLQEVYVGEVVMASDTTENGFAYCCYNGEWGYILNRYLTSKIHTWSEGSFHVGNCTSYINLRQFPVSGSTSVGTVPKGKRFSSVIYHDDAYDPDKWVYVTYHGVGGFTKWKYVVYED